MKTKNRQNAEYFRNGSALERICVIRYSYYLCDVEP
nr:MAG TPA: hypothetical protein [Caudoviricetes sp.]